MPLLLHAVFFASGLSAILFETLWFRQAGLAFGNSVWASSLVLAGFMGGAALGNLLAARIGDRARVPLRTYAALEVTIGLSGVALVYFLPGLASALKPLFGPLADHPLVLNALRAALAFALLLVPSAAMGMTLPVFTRAVAAHDPNFGAVLGRLYAWNTLGAVSGVLAGEFFLVARVGIHGTALCAALLNGLLAALTVWLPPQTPRPAEAVPATPPSRPRRERQASRASGWPWFAAAGLSGFCLLALEVIWFRLLLLVVHGHSEAFAVMLATVLAGIALGGLAGGAWLRRSPQAFSAGSRVAFGSAILVGASYWALRLVVVRFGPVLIAAPRDIAAVGVPLMLPVATLSGVLFTFAAAALRDRHATAAATTGRVAFVNTLGSAVGSLAAGFLLLPLLGIERSLFAIAAAYVAIGAWLLLTQPPPRGVGYGLAVVSCLSLALFPFGTVRDGLLQVPLTRLTSQWGPRAPLGSGVPEIAMVREGLTDTVTYYRVPLLGQTLFHVMWSNAVPLADTEWESRRYMKEYVYWPAAVHPAMTRALLIAYGVGNTAQAMTESDTLTSIDIVDISQDVLDMSAVVHPASNPLHDPRVHVHVEDGRFFLQTTGGVYDLITSEPPPPVSAGVVNLYTREYFTLLRSHLAEDGIVVYWLPIHALSDSATRSILSAFCGVFDDCSLWHGIGSELMLVGTRRTTGPVSEDHFTRQWRTPRILAEMARLGFERPEQLGALFIGDAGFLAGVVAGAPPVVDNFPKRIAARTPSDGDSLLNTFFDAGAAHERFRHSALVARLWPPSLIAASLPYFDVQDRINRYSFGRATFRDVYDLLTTTTVRMPVEWILGTNADADRVVGEVAPDVQATPVAQFHLGIRLLAARRYDAAAEALSHAVPQRELGAQAFGLQTFALAMAGRVDEARQAVHERIGRFGPSAQVPPGDRSQFWSVMRETFGIERR